MEDEPRNYSVTVPEEKSVEDGITDALTRHLIEEYGEGEQVVTGWLLIGESIDGDGNQEPIALTSDGLSWVTTLGLLEAGKLILRQDFDE